MKKIITIATIILSQVLSGQDATFTLIDNNPVSINPAFCLPAENKLQVMTLTRQQWWNLPGPTGRSAAYHMNNSTILIPIIADRFTSVGTSLQGFTNSGGEGDFSYSGVTSTFGVRKDISLPSRAILSTSVGLGLSFRKFSIDWDQLTFSSQLDPFYGYISNIPLINPRVNNSPDYFTVTQNFGFNFELVPRSRDWKVAAGLGCFNFSNLASYTFFDQGSSIPKRTAFNFSYINFTNGSGGLVEDLHSSYYILRFNCERQATLQNTELRMGTNIAGALTTYVGYRRRSLNLIDQNQDAILWSIQINAPRFMFSIGYDYTVSSLNIQRTRGTTEAGLIIPFGARGGIRGRRASEPCYVDYLLTHSEWKAVEQFNNKSTDWGREYAPVTFIR